MLQTELLLLKGHCTLQGGGGHLGLCRSIWRGLEESGARHQTCQHHRPAPAQQATAFRCFPQQKHNDQPNKHLLPCRGHFPAPPPNLLLSSDTRHTREAPLCRVTFPHAFFAAFALLRLPTTLLGTDIFPLPDSIPHAAGSNSHSLEQLTWQLAFVQSPQRRMALRQQRRCAFPSLRMRLPKAKPVLGCVLNASAFKHQSSVTVPSAVHIRHPKYLAGGLVLSHVHRDRLLACMCEWATLGKAPASVALGGSLCIQATRYQAGGLLA